MLSSVYREVHSGVLFGAWLVTHWISYMLRFPQHYAASLPDCEKMRENIRMKTQYNGPEIKCNQESYFTYVS